MSLIIVLEVELEGYLSPLFFREQVIGLGIVPRLNQFDRIDMLVERVGSFLLKKGLDVFEHGLAEGSLQNNLVCTLVGRVQICVDLPELVLQVEYLEVDELVLDVSHREEGPHLIPRL